MSVALAFDFGQFDEFGEAARAVARRDEVVNDDRKDEERHGELVHQGQSGEGL